MSRPHKTKLDGLLADLTKTLTKSKVNNDAATREALRILLEAEKLKELRQTRRRAKGGTGQEYDPEEAHNAICHILGMEPKPLEEKIKHAQWEIEFWQGHLADLVGKQDRMAARVHKNLTAPAEGGAKNG